MRQRGAKMTPLEVRLVVRCTIFKLSLRTM